MDLFKNVFGFVGKSCGWVSARMVEVMGGPKETADECLRFGEEAGRALGSLPDGAIWAAGQVGGAVGHVAGQGAGLVIDGTGRVCEVVLDEMGERQAAETVRGGSQWLSEKTADVATRAGSIVGKAAVLKLMLVAGPLALLGGALGESVSQAADAADLANGASSLGDAAHALGSNVHFGGYSEMLIARLPAGTSVDEVVY